MKQSLLLLLSLLPSWGRTCNAFFPNTENPISSECGGWLNGATDGLDWTNERTTPGLVFGTEATGAGTTDDSTAALTGSWGPDQTVTGKAHYTGGAAETELRCRTTITAHSITGYEVNFSAGYTQIVRWNGALNDFSLLASNFSFVIHDGDNLKITCIGSVITVYQDTGSGYVQVNTFTDATYATGAPGVGSFYRGCGCTQNSIGWSTFTATDGLSSGGGSMLGAGKLIGSAIVH